MLGQTIRTSDLLTVEYVDFSGCRSPSRARRRLRQGIAGRVKRYRIPDPKAYQIAGEIWMHPALAGELKRRFLADAPNMESPFL
jgi:hypothetical protein